MAMQNIYTPDEIKRRTEEFEAANHRDHVRFVLGATVIGLLILGLMGMAAYFTQSWAI